MKNENEKISKKKRTTKSTNNNQNTKNKKKIDKSLIELERDLENDIGKTIKQKKQVVPVKVVKKEIVKIEEQKKEIKEIIPKKETKKIVLKTHETKTTKIARKRLKLKTSRLVLVVAIVIAFVALITFGVKKYNIYKKEQAEIAYQQKLKEKIKDIKSHYNEFVITNKDANIYERKENNYNKIGTISQNMELEIEPLEEITSTTDYFFIPSLEAYIKYQDVKKINALTEHNKRYEKYIVFNENIITTSPTNFYDNNNLIISINKSFNLPIIIKDTDKYYVDYYDQLLQVKKENVENIVENNNTTAATNNRIKTIVYHFIYQDAVKDDCHQSICHHVNQFDSHMKYISENGFLTLTMKEMEMFLDGKIRIPKNSVVITIDDGWLAGNAIPILEKYQVNATLFVVTSWYKKENFVSDYLELHSHSHNLHNQYVCKGGNQGGGILCLDKETLLNDLKTSRESLDNTAIFCYPFYDYNDYAISILKEAGFTMAFAGYEGVGGISTPSTNRYKLTRTTLNGSTIVSELARILNY